MKLHILGVWQNARKFIRQLAHWTCDQMLQVELVAVNNNKLKLNIYTAHNIINDL